MDISVYRYRVYPGVDGDYAIWTSPATGTPVLPGIGNQIIDVSNSIGETRERIDRTDASLVHERTRIDRADVSIGEHGVQLDTHRTRIDRADSSIGLHTTQINDRHTKAYVDGSLGTHRTRIDRADASIGRHNTRLNNHDTSLGNFKKLAYKDSVDLSSTDVLNKTLANLDSAAATKLGTIATGATVGATWNTNITSQPTSLELISINEYAKLQAALTDASAANMYVQKVDYERFTQGRSTLLKGLYDLADDPLERSTNSGSYIPLRVYTFQYDWINGFHWEYERRVSSGTGYARIRNTRTGYSVPSPATITNTSYLQVAGTWAQDVSAGDTLVLEATNMSGGYTYVKLINLSFTPNYTQYVVVT